MYRSASWFSIWAGFNIWLPFRSGEEGERKMSLVLWRKSTVWIGDGQSGAEEFEFSDRTRLLTDMKTPNVPPPWTMTLPVCFISSIPRKPALFEENQEIQGYQSVWLMSDLCGDDRREVRSIDRFPTSMNQRRRRWGQMRSQHKSPWQSRPSPGPSRTAVDLSSTQSLLQAFFWFRTLLVANRTRQSGQNDRCASNAYWSLKISVYYRKFKNVNKSFSLKKRVPDRKLKRELKPTLKRVGRVGKRFEEYSGFLVVNGLWMPIVQQNWKQIGFSWSRLENTFTRGLSDDRARPADFEQPHANCTAAQACGANKHALISIKTSNENFNVKFLREL